MPIELQHDGEPEPDPGQTIYEALSSLQGDFDELTLMGFLAALQRGESWARLAPQHRALCEFLEGELFEDG